jgi:hypothetical protein
VKACSDERMLRSQRFLEDGERAEVISFGVVEPVLAVLADVERVIGRIVFQPKGRDGFEEFDSAFVLVSRRSSPWQIRSAQGNPGLGLSPWHG